MIGPKSHATLRLNISQTFYPIGAAAGILLGKYLVFSDGESLEKQMAGMNAEQIHNFKVLMLENTLEPYKYMIMVLVVVMVLFLLTRFPTCKVAQTANHKRPSAADTLRYGHQRTFSSRNCRPVPVCRYAGHRLVVHHSPCAGTG